jgi:hypothetical protein
MAGRNPLEALAISRPLAGEAAKPQQEEARRREPEPSEPEAPSARRSGVGRLLALMALLRPLTRS